MKAIEALLALPPLMLLASCVNGNTADGTGDLTYGDVITQVTVNKIKQMPDMPATYRMLDWEKKAKDYDAYVFDWNRSNSVGPLIWLDESHKNSGGETFGLFTTVGDIRQGEDKSGGSSHEAINTMAAVLGAGLVGIDKTCQDGYDYVKMLQNYYASSNGWDIMVNNTSGYATDWWYNVLPNILYYGVCDLFPGVDGADDIQKSIADKFAEADGIMEQDYDYSYFDFGNMRGVVNSLPCEQDAAGGQGYVLLCAWHKFGDDSYLEHCKNAISVLDSQTESRFYEILMPFGVYAAAYLNAVEGTDYDVKKMLNWVFEGCTSSSGRKGWGVIAGTWGPYDVSGLQGSTTDGGGYAFLMNSLEIAWPLVPMVKYQPQFAQAIGKWMLNDASACRLFYPQDMDDTHQYAPELKNITDNNVAYEGLRYYDRYGTYPDVHPVAEGDGPTWVSGNPKSTMFSLYSTSPVGILGAIVNTTNVDGILQLDCNATDFYADKPYPVYLYYNPYGEPRTVEYRSSQKCDLFDIVSKTYAAKKLDVSGTFEIPACCAMVLVELPSGISLKVADGRITADKKNVIAYY